MVAWVSHPEVAATGFDFKLVGGGRPGSPAWQRNVEELERTLEGDLAVALDRAGRRTVMRTLSAEYCAAIAEYDRGLREPQRYAKFRCESRIAELEAML